VVGGLLLHQLRRPLSEVVLGRNTPACASKFAKLRAECVRPKTRCAPAWACKARDEA
jgi:hypothetical protein